MWQPDPHGPCHSPVWHTRPLGPPREGGAHPHLLVYWGPGRPVTSDLNAPPPACTRTHTTHRQVLSPGHPHPDCTGRGDPRPPSGLTPTRPSRLLPKQSSSSPKHGHPGARALAQPAGGGPAEAAWKSEAEECSGQLGRETGGLRASRKAAARPSPTSGTSHWTAAPGSGLQQRPAPSA